MIADPPRPRTTATVAFVVGAASLGTEIGAARLLAPFFGDSTFVWANTIATILVGLAAGYWFGGRLADRRPRLSVMCALIAAAAVLLALVPFVARPLLGAASSALDEVSAGAFVGSLVGVLGLVFLPVCLLGAVAPFTIRLSVAEVADAGRVSGRIYAVSTIGSLVGTFLAALLLIPAIGTRKTFLVFALSLALVAMVGLPRRLILIPLAVGALFVVPVGAVKPPGAGERLLYEEETPYQYARVVERPDGERLLELDEGQAVHSVYRPGSFLTGGYWDDSLVLPFATRGGPPRRIAILGDAAGSMARGYGHFFPRTRIDAVEIDAAVTAIGRRFFNLAAPHLRTITADARVFVRNPGPDYQAIILDAYRQPYIPFHLTTREFFEELRERLAPGGVVLVNVGHPEGSDELEKVLAATMESSLPFVSSEPFDRTNTWLLGAMRRPRPARILAARWLLAPPLDPIAARAARRMRPPPTGGEVYTDDHAPIEWLIDRSLLGYAEGDR
ncbi:MAG TPA: fused MFS/spermidine synthase [Solirubrobacterales bacterium]|nr:fused MFS/spermidine synthase [Solirubrobacterales bacterium]